MQSSPQSANSEFFQGYRIFERRVVVAGRAYCLIGPVNYESLIDDPRVQERFREDEFMPYWAEFWPAAILLAEEIAAWGPPTLAEPDSAPTGSALIDAAAAPTAQPPRVLEIGAGLGLAGLVAHQLGYPTIISDYDEDALAFIAESARRSDLPPAKTRFVDWREFYPDLISERIVAVEVLYERRNLPAVAEFLRRHLAEKGVALICDGERQVADGFPSIAAEHGLHVVTRPLRAVNPLTKKPVAGRLFDVRRVESR